MYNETYIPRDDPRSVTNASFTVRVQSSSPRPAFAQAYYDAVLAEPVTNSTAVQGLRIIVANRNHVRTGIMLLAHTSHNNNNNKIVIIIIIIIRYSSNLRLTAC